MMTEKKYRVHEALKYNYSDIGEYVDENHTDKPLRNDIVVNLLNEQEEHIKDLETRNKRQYERLKELGDLMFKRDWETLNDMVDEWEKEEEQLRKYGG